MKRFFLLLLCAALTAVAWSCAKEETDDTGSDTPAAPTGITLTPDAIAAEQAAGSYSLAVTAPARPKIASDSDWVTVTDGTYSEYKITFTVKVAANATYETRTATLTVTAGSQTATATVTQEGRESVNANLPSKDKIRTSLVTSGATDAAVSLYNQLYSLYREKTVSAILANVNWNHTEADKIFKATGKYPAINTFDFIHILYSGENWINYSDITPVSEWAAAGGIVSLMWHFNVPTYNGSSEVTCTPSKTTFTPTNALTEGTWENTWYKEQMEKVADVILLLQDAGIAALWRPYHEGAGNYHSLKWAGTSWFWWGIDGPEIYKKLWVDMYEYFYSKGIRNLIWTWTTQNYNGDSTAFDCDDAWYPGEQYVDIVGRDIYTGNAEGIAEEFVQIQSKYEQHMVAMAECGNSDNYKLPKMSDIINAGGMWLYFCPWYGSNMPDTAWWTDAFGDECVITRDEVK